ncbi:TRAP transporter small permease [Sporolituus thermophilus]|uniref:TRAP-type C4-dicarboxylate transport system, small permease component n=1 Tax=Sporolituus thermophilus DSM 23256 TaxID=1123285 RepID=A0A1G7K8K0_9FIRM|nr:TRAP transporter small permease [Sporolituus thermophilus]SDF33467.1 TRAP-type C4-dicarboxylate transport system, small permease component [Sporolituus thermophilus DSM 23256]
MGRIIWRMIKNLDDILGMLFMAFIILLACANVFMRYVVGKPWGWVEEVTIFTFVWLTMLGAASVIKAEGHCSIDVLARKLPSRAKWVLNLLVDVCVIATLLLMIWYGTKLALSASQKLTPMLGIPYTYVDLAVPVGSAFMLLYYIRLFWLDLTGKRENCNIEE